MDGAWALLRAPSCADPAYAFVSTVGSFLSLPPCSQAPLTEEGKQPALDAQKSYRSRSMYHPRACRDRCTLDGWKPNGACRRLRCYGCSTGIFCQTNGGHESSKQITCISLHVHVSHDPHALHDCHARFWLQPPTPPPLSSSRHPFSSLSKVDGFSSDTSVEFEDLMASRNLREMKEEVIFFFSQILCTNSCLRLLLLYGYRSCPAHNRDPFPFSMPGGSPQR